VPALSTYQRGVIRRIGARRDRRREGVVTVIVAFAPKVLRSDRADIASAGAAGDLDLIAASERWQVEVGG
jgi:hypothetical protein